MTDTPLITLDEAMEQFNIAHENRPMVRDIASRIDLLGFDVKSSYIKGIRADGLHALQICKGYTEYFATEAEAGEASGRPERVWGVTLDSGTQVWGVSHPTVGRGGGRAGSRTPVRKHEEPRDYGVCETCWQAKTPSGSCGCDE
ncbi:hypothetical protein [Demequina sp. NBRC 110055]|uniref:hypothetical protein n=1 Tax=Demequina sp. NBRC 110055 TaxID=1570344 RepID=UPI0009FEE7CD|nr:hypothetical protein [Demequina sp. NBRC 110055]